MILTGTVTEAPPPADEVAAAAPFFIVGSGRSGSTLLRLMLASHSRLTIPPETWYLIPLLKRFNIDQRLNADEVELAISIITSHYRWPDMRLDAQDFRRQASRLPKPSLRDLVEIVYRTHLQAEGKARWGDKTPLNGNAVATSASRLGLTVRETPATVEVLDRQTIQEQGYRTTAEAANGAVGV